MFNLADLQTADNNNYSLTGKNTRRYTGYMWHGYTACASLNVKKEYLKKKKFYNK
jgi:hypothetical protein